MDNNVSKELILWYMINKRDLPWRKSHDPYHVWVSEIILQQTRVAQGLPYYMRFIETFPTIKNLADAPQEQILKLWQGLGYYSRARNMHTASQQIIEKFGGQFPTTYKELLQLKGVGDYTAAAVSSLAFNEPVAVVDGNVIRVITRLFGIEAPVDKPSTLKDIKTIATELLDKEKPALHNQAMMEFGALHCVPVNPNCNICVLNHKCLALKYKSVSKIPAKSQKLKIKNRFFHYLVINVNNKIFFQRRGAGDIWEGLYEFPLIETQETVSPESLHKLLDNFNLSTSIVKIKNITTPVKHILTHQNLHVTFIYVQSNNLSTIPVNWIQTDIQKISDLAVPRVIDRYLNSPAFNKANESMH
jgi:A/G-specific adenine glycosylase